MTRRPSRRGGDAVSTAATLLVTLIGAFLGTFAWAPTPPAPVATRPAETPECTAPIVDANCALWDGLGSSRS